MTPNFIGPDDEFTNLYPSDELFLDCVYRKGGYCARYGLEIRGDRAPTPCQNMNQSGQLCYEKCEELDVVELAHRL